MTERFNLLHPQESLELIVYTVCEYFEKRKALSTCGPDLDLDYDIIALRGFTAKDHMILFNTKLIDESDETMLVDELFSATPGLVCKIRRPVKIKIRATSIDNAAKTHEFDGPTARSILHEMDKLQGKNPMRRANLYHKEKAFKRFAKYKKALTQTPK